MKMTILILTVALIYLSCILTHAQEFKVHSNGLIYDDITMNKLGLIIDSLNLKFKSCDLDHSYYSLDQGNGTIVDCSDKEIKKIIKEGISFSTFKTEHKKKILQENIWMVKHQYTNYDEKKIIEYAPLPGMKGTKFKLKNIPKNNKTTGWIIDQDRALYLDNLSSIEIPEKFARLIQYVDCMIDTTASIYFPDAKPNYYTEFEHNSNIGKFLNWINSYPDEPVYPEFDNFSDAEFDSLYQIYVLQLTTWTEQKLRFFDEKLNESHYRKSQLIDAKNEALENGVSDAELEFYVARHLSPEDALAMKRNRRVVGMCSMDNSPRIHAMQICVLAAETQKWDIFLRSHLDIMNDRFDRMSDGSYAWEGRQTYLKELEELGINAIDLLLGTCFRSVSVDGNHYVGSIGRIGRALAEAADKETIETLVFTAISDDVLDIYNRLLFSYLFSHYNHNLMEESRRKANEARFQDMLKRLPCQIQTAWED